MTCWETWKASVVLFYCSSGVFTICSSAPVLTSCLLVTSSSSWMLWQRRWPSKMTDKCRGRPLTNWLGRTMSITTPYAVLEMLHILSLRLETAEAPLAQKQMLLSGWMVYLMFYSESISGSIWILVSLPLCFILFPPSQGEYMSQQLLRPRRVSRGELHWFGVLWMRSQLEGGSLRHTLLPGWLRLPRQRSLPGEDVRLQDRMARWAGTAAASLALAAGDVTSLSHTLRPFE